VRVPPPNELGPTPVSDVIPRIWMPNTRVVCTGGKKSFHVAIQPSENLG
jgi:hypothetical protein